LGILFRSRYFYSPSGIGLAKAQGEFRPARGRVLDRYQSFLQARAAEVGFNAVVLYLELAAQGYEGSYAAVAKYVSPWRQPWHGQEPASLRFETEPGEQAQVDWGSTWVYLGEERIRVHVFTMVLGFSRRLFARAYLNEGLESLLEAHGAAFTHFGGRTSTILYDTILNIKGKATG
jgi:transposase